MFRVLREESGSYLIQVTGRFKPLEESVSAARRFVGSSLVDWNRPQEVDVVVLLTSEVVTNAILHAGPHGPGAEVVVALSRTGDVVRVEVADGHPGIPVVGDGDLDRPCGRGLVLLDALAKTWGVTTANSGKGVWFEVQA